MLLTACGVTQTPVEFFSGIEHDFTKPDAGASTQDQGQLAESPKSFHLAVH